MAEDSVRAMSALVQASVRQLRSIYWEPNDARSVQLIEAALKDIPAFNQRLSAYTTSLPREQQQQLAQRLRQQPWQVELQTLLRSPQYRNFDARAAKNPALKAAAARLQAASFFGPTHAAPAPAVAAATPTPAPAAPVPVKSAPAAVPEVSKPTTARLQHTVQKGETLFSIARRYGVKPKQIQEWNAKADNGVKIGEVLAVEPAR
ncbi:LysM peptidoglycan-binding domain-containing protein [Hymenobacter lutimineralis]|uniref:LysM peptidoglycan-binding domain-containing protein n=1 Tax=Hymenobacter lutimineralis TaxID=2606448 RepID=A0A5D6UV70_9BACT|nr:LysM peptidoglycan-binding domain-containing protein [Hymenobacter lutimineralis]